MRWLERLLRRGAQEARLDAELRDHLERLTAEYVAAGMSEPDARRRARLEFGGVEQIKEDCRDVRGTRLFDDLVQDVRYGLRMLKASPAVTFVAVASLALGIGANGAMFSLVDSVLLKTLPVREPERLVLLEGGSWTNPIWEQIRDRQSEIAESAAAWSDARFDLSRGGQTEFAEGLWVSGAFFDALGVPAILGRTLSPADDRRDAGPDGPVAVISYAFWQKRFNGAADVVGRQLLLDRVSFTIVGVTPPSFFGPAIGRSFDVAVPLGASAIVMGNRHWLDARSTWILEIVARLRPGQTAEDATLALRGVQSQIREATLPLQAPEHALAEHLREGLTWLPAAAGPSGLREQYDRPLLIIMAVVVMVLLIACANIANLLLARAASRQHELSMRLALGASRLRLARQLLTESLLLSTIGAAAGLVFAEWANRLLVQQFSTPRRTVVLDLGPDLRIVAFTAAVAVITALLFGLAPALRARRIQPGEAIKENARTVAGMRRPLGGPLIVVQVALSLMLVVGAGLFLRTFGTLATLDLGLDRDAILVVDVDASRAAPDPAGRRAVFDRVLENAAGVPGVAGVGFSTITPVSGSGWNGGVNVGGQRGAPDRARMTFFNAITPGWLGTYGTALKAGRDFDARDSASAPRVAIANEAFVARFVGGSPVGYVVQVDMGPRDEDVPLEIVGVVENAVYRSVRDPVPPVLYLPWSQVHSGGAPASATLSLRAAAGSPMLLSRSVGEAILRANGDLSMTFRPLAAFVDGALVRERIMAMLSGFFGGLALLLAGIGMYGMTSYAVTNRRAEIGIRMALGADAAQVVRMVMRQFAILVAIGLVIGGAASIWSASYVETLLYGLPAKDPLTLAGAAGVLIATGAVAAWLPARRAARIDPARVLRES
jgi:predicted permease